LIKILPLYRPKVMVNTFGIIGYLCALTFIAFWGVAQCNLVDYIRIYVEYVTYTVRNFELNFDFVPFHCA
jgi:hypothetical protein